MMKFLQKILGAGQNTPNPAPCAPGDAPPDAPADAPHTIELLIVDWDMHPDVSPETRFGGQPAVGDGFAWPCCASCGGNMQFQGQIRPEGAQHLLLLFMCANHPGECDQFLADGGGNAVIAVRAQALHHATPPASGETLRATRHGARTERVAAPDYTAAYAAYGERAGRRRDVLGQLGGQPDWLQSEAAPHCDACAAPMQFVAQLESGPDHASEMNFAGGCGYLFECRCAGVSGKFLSQS